MLASHALCVIVCRLFACDPCVKMYENDTSRCCCCSFCLCLCVFGTAQRIYSADKYIWIHTHIFLVEIAVTRAITYQPEFANFAVAAHNCSSRNFYAKFRTILFAIFCSLPAPFALHFLPIWRTIRWARSVQDLFKPI